MGQSMWLKLTAMGAVGIPLLWNTPFIQKPRILARFSDNIEGIGKQKDACIKINQRPSHNVCEEAKSAYLI